MIFKAIQTALSPNNTWKDTSRAFWEIIFPPNWFFWKKGKSRLLLEKQFAGKFGFKDCRAVANGRDGLYLILKSFELTPGSEVLVQSFTCMVVINAIIWNGLTPVYVDVDPETLSLDPEDLKRKISAKTRAVIVQHSFGINGPIAAVKNFCQEKNLLMIEDCAHSVGGKIGDRILGRDGDFSFFSFGRSKAMSCVNGGMIVCNNPDYLERLENALENIPETDNGTIFRNLLHPLICSLAKFFYGWGKLGQAIMVISQKLKLLTMEVTASEKKALRPEHPARKLPNALAKLALIQLEQIDRFNAHRQKLSSFYQKQLAGIPAVQLFKIPEGNVLLRFPLRLKNAKTVLKKLNAKHIYLGDWYKTPIAPPDIDVGKSGYQPGSCRNTEEICGEIINLPLHQGISENDAKLIIKYLKDEIG